VLSAIYEQDFLPCSFGGRPKLSAHHALATLNEVIAGGMISWVAQSLQIYPRNRSLDQELIVQIPCGTEQGIIFGLSGN